jgi:hypothetical protein
MARQRRLKRALVSGQDIVRTLAGEIISPLRGVPGDAQFEWANYDPRYNGWWIFLSHPSWPEVPECQVIPTWEWERVATS